MITQVLMLCLLVGEPTNIVQAYEDQFGAGSYLTDVIAKNWLLEQHWLDAKVHPIGGRPWARGYPHILYHQWCVGDLVGEGLEFRTDMADLAEYAKLRRPTVIEQKPALEIKSDIEIMAELSEILMRLE